MLSFARKRARGVRLAMARVAFVFTDFTSFSRI
jgi:hypothetical protein